MNRKAYTLFILAFVVLLAVYLDYASKEFSITQAPQASFLDESGFKHTLDDYKGRVILLHFWATWCPPCLEEMPSLVQLIKKLENEDLVILALSLDDSLEEIKKFKKGHQITLPLYFDEKAKVANAFGTYRLPESYLINKKGSVVRKIIGPQNWLSPSWVEEIKKLQASSKHR